MTGSIRFHPPRLQLSEETGWLLWRAFGPTDRPGSPARNLDPERIVDLGQRLELLTRVGSRISADVLAGEVGEKAAEAMLDVHRTTAALVLTAEGICRKIGETAQGMDVRLVFLKGMALQLAGVVKMGSRALCDVDVLVSVKDAQRVQQALIDSGCRESGLRASDHQLVALEHPTGLMVEVHTKVPGLNLLGSDGSVDVGKLLRSGMCAPVAGFPSCCLIPSDEVVAAHVLVHGIDQHGFAPHEYSMTKMLADIQDLLPALGGAAVFLDGARRLISEAVARDEVMAVFDLAERLGQGGDPCAISEEESNAGGLLRHMVAGQLDREYRYALRLRHQRFLMAKGSLLSFAVRAVVPTDAQLDLLYGRPQTRLGYWGWRLWRPFDLIIRAVRYTMAWMVHRPRQRG